MLLLLPCTCMATAGVTVAAAAAAAASSSRRALTAAASSSRHHAHARRRPFSSSPVAQRVRARRPPGSSGSNSNSSAKGGNDDGEEVRYNFNPNPFDPTPVDAAARAGYPTVTANDFKRHTSPPRKVRMLARDFIDDSLYNPNYGYFPKQAVIFDPDAAVDSRKLRDVMQETAGPVASITAGPESAQKSPSEEQAERQAKTVGRRRSQGFDFASMRNMSDWDRTVAETYGLLEDADEKTSGLGRQVWHTPTELFKPYYAQAVAHHLATEYKLTLFPYNDLNIFEIGAGNGSLMAGILDFLHVEEPEVYKRTRYHTIEISAQLAALQEARAKKAGHAERVTVVQQSIFDWDRTVTDPCFFLAFEVLDNLSHDIVRYKVDDNTPLQCMVEIDDRGDFSEVYQPVSDPLIRQFLRIRSEIRRGSKYAHTSLHPFLASHPAVRKLYSSLPLSPNLSPPDFLPTKSLLLLQQLRSRFLNHRILMSDFDYLPDTIPGRMAPVVQTRYEGQSVTCSTYLVSQGWFDIFFPTDFRFLRDMYDNVMAHEEHEQDLDELEGEQAEPRVLPRKSSSSSSRDKSAGIGLGWGNNRGLRVLSHRQFLERYGEPEATALQDGTNPMLDLYENAAFIY